MNFYTLQQLQVMYPSLSIDEIAKRARIARDLVEAYLGSCCSAVKCCCGTCEGIYNGGDLPIADAFSYWIIEGDITHNGILYPDGCLLVQTTGYPLGDFDYQVVEGLNCEGYVCVKPSNIDIAFLLAFEDAGDSCCDTRSFSFGSIRIDNNVTAISDASILWKQLLAPYKCVKGYKI